MAGTWWKRWLACRWTSSLCSGHPERSLRTAAGRPKRGVKLALEQLEDRLTPTVVFTPTFGAEPTVVGATSNQLMNPTYYLIFQNADGQSWQTTWSNLADSIITRAKELFDPSSHYYDGLKQYGNTGATSYGGAVFDSFNLTSGFGNVSADGLLFHAHTNDLNSVITNAIDHDGLPQPNAHNVYVVFTPPGTTSDGGKSEGGYNTPMAYTRVNLFNPVSLTYNIWVGNPSPATTDPGQYSLDLDDYSQTLSHESVEQMASPFGPGLQDKVPIIGGLIGGPGISVSHGANFPDGGFGKHQIADLEPDGVYYSRVNGINEQAYWSVKDQGFIVPDGNSERFEIDPQYNTSGSVGKYQCR